jgi:hypothetical protein
VRALHYKRHFIMNLSQNLSDTNESRDPSPSNLTTMSELEMLLSQGESLNFESDSGALLPESTGIAAESLPESQIDGPISQTIMTFGSDHTRVCTSSHSKFESRSGGNILADRPVCEMGIMSNALASSPERLPVMTTVLGAPVKRIGAKRPRDLELEVLDESDDEERICQRMRYASIKKKDSGKSGH